MQKSADKDSKKLETCKNLLQFAKDKRSLVITRILVLNSVPRQAPNVGTQIGFFKDLLE